MLYFNPSHRVSHKAILVLFYLQFFAVQWALRYTFPPEQNRHEVLVSASQKKAGFSLADDKEDQLPSNLRLNKRYFPISWMAVSSPAVPAPIYYFADTHQCADPQIIFISAFRPTTSQRGPPIS
ncbi:hypothetical protein [Pollutibacter soli]|uniref:hypothetical protein n=1 Tax=Pollutibacter soli TaxID=3034157 RepID=UPI003013B610